MDIAIIDTRIGCGTAFQRLLSNVSTRSVESIPTAHAGHRRTSTKGKRTGSIVECRSAASRSSCSLLWTWVIIISSSVQIEPPVAANEEESEHRRTFLQCGVCHDKATGILFGLATCEGCKGRAKYLRDSFLLHHTSTCFSILRIFQAHRTEQEEISLHWQWLVHHR